MAEQAMPLNNQAPAMDPLVAKPMESDLLKNIVSTETGTNDAPILGEAPELDTSLLRDVAPQKSVLLVILKILFGLLFFASLASVAFFTSQLTHTFDFVTSNFNWPNVSADLASTNTEIISLQTDLNMSRFQEIKESLDKFSYDGDEYLQQYENLNSSTTSAQEKLDAKTAMDEARSNLKGSFADARAKISKDFIAPLIDINFTTDQALQSLYEDKLRTAIGDKMIELAKGTDDSTKMDYRNLQQTLRLIGNTELKNTLIKTDFDSLKDDDSIDGLKELIKKIDSLTVSDMSATQTIKFKRIKWSDIISEIDHRTILVDKYYNDNFYSSRGGIRYNSYDFDSSTGKISINGETKSLTPENFTTIALLIEQLNQSDKFMNADMRSFSKSGSLQEGYLSTLRLVLDLRPKNNTNAVKTK